MSRMLLLLRHGKSDWDTDDDDFNRPLKKRGFKAARQIGKWLKDNKLIPDFIVSSPANRAITTAEAVSKALRIKKSRILKEKHIYLATPDELLYVLAECPEQAECVMMVGHNPGMEDLLYYLAGGQFEVPDDGKLLPTAALAVLEMPNKWQKLERGSATLKQLVRPRDLPDINEGD